MCESQILQKESKWEWLVFKAHHQCRPSNAENKEKGTRFKWPACRRKRDMPEAHSSCLPEPRHMLRLPHLYHLSLSPLLIVNCRPRIQISFVADVSRHAVRYVCCVSSVQITNCLSVAIRIIRCVRTTSNGTTPVRDTTVFKEKHMGNIRDTMIPAPPSQAWTEKNANLRLHICTHGQRSCLFAQRGMWSKQKPKTINRPLKLLLPHPHTPSHPPPAETFHVPFRRIKLEVRR